MAWSSKISKIHVLLTKTCSILVNLGVFVYSTLLGVYCPLKPCLPCLLPGAPPPPPIVGAPRGGAGWREGPAYCTSRSLALSKWVVRKQLVMADAIFESSLFLLVAGSLICPPSSMEMSFYTATQIRVIWLRYSCSVDKSFSYLIT